MSTYEQVISWLMEVLFPPRCVGCDIILGFKRKHACFCANCLNLIPLKNNFVCVFCDTKSGNGRTCPYCVKENNLDQLLTAAEYGGIVRKALKETKYRQIKNIINDLSGIFVKFISKQIKSGKLEFIGDEIILPVPLAKLRFNRRGFNQAAILAEHISQKTGIPVLDGIIKKQITLRNQADIKDKAGRIKNAVGRHRCAKSDLVRNKTIWLVDDVATTGSTLEDCARTLKEAGALKVVGLVFAKGYLKTKNREKLAAGRILGEKSFKKSVQSLIEPAS